MVCYYSAAKKCGWKVLQNRIISDEFLQCRQVQLCSIESIAVKLCEQVHFFFQPLVPQSLLTVAGEFESIAVVDLVQESHVPTLNVVTLYTLCLMINVVAAHVLQTHRSQVAPLALPVEIYSIVWWIFISVQIVLCLLELVVEQTNQSLTNGFSYLVICSFIIIRVLLAYRVEYCAFRVLRSG